MHFDVKTNSEKNKVRTYKNQTHNDYQQVAKVSTATYAYPKDNKLGNKGSVYKIIPRPPLESRKKPKESTRKPSGDIQIEDKKYMSLGARYTQELDSMINRYEKVAELKDKKR